MRSVRSFLLVCLVILPLIGLGQEGWYRKETGTQEGLERIQFFDSLNGWMCGSEGNAYHTTDGGEHWTQFLPPLEYEYFYFMNDSIGFVNGKTADKKHSTIRRTSDRGQTWSEPYWYHQNAVHVDMTHIGDTVILLNESNILKSIDAGVTWNNLESYVIGYPQGMTFTTSSKGYMVGKYSVEFPGNQHAFAYTLDGGEHWYEKSIYFHSWGEFKDVIQLSNGRVFIVGSERLITLII